MWYVIFSSQTVYQHLFLKNSKKEKHCLIFLKPLVWKTLLPNFCLLLTKILNFHPFESNYVLFCFFSFLPAQLDAHIIIIYYFFLKDIIKILAEMVRMLLIMKPYQHVYCWGWLFTIWWLLKTLIENFFTFTSFIHQL